MIQLVKPTNPKLKKFNVFFCLFLRHPLSLLVNDEYFILLHVLCYILFVIINRFIHDLESVFRDT